MAQLAQGIREGDRLSLAKGITLMESHRMEDWEGAKKLLNLLGEREPSKSKRLGFSGPPGVGKSHFIGKLGLELVGEGESVAVLAIDPSSELTGGSILGDKTRMEELSSHPQAFLRPSATRGHLGGVTSRLPGVVRLCEGAGYQWILIESVGVGQSEVELSQMVDFFTLISQPGAGDELQGIKKGILEYVDLILVNKNDRDPGLVNITCQQYMAALKILHQKKVSVLPCSALTGQGVKKALETLKTLYGEFDFSKRSQEARFWFESLLQSEFKKRLLQESSLNPLVQQLGEEISKGEENPMEGVDRFFKSLMGTGG